MPALANFGPRPLLVAAAALLIGLKLVMMLTAGPFMDEAYYFMWGQHPGWSYYDHPALVGWTQSVGWALGGFSLIGLRLMPLMTFVGDVVLLALFARRLVGEQWEQLFWPSLVFFLATPLFFAMTGVALPDHLLIFLSLAALYGFFVYFAEPDSRSGRTHLFAAALALGLAILAKYNAALLGVALGIYIVAVPRLRPLLLRRQLWLAVLVVASVQTPVLIWNAQNGWASFAFILGGRHNTFSPELSLDKIGWFVGQTIGVLWLFLVPLIGLVLPGRHFAGRGLARVATLVPTLVFLSVSALTLVLFHWNLPGYVAAIPFAMLWLRSRIVFWAQAGIGVVIALALIFNYAIVPITALVADGDEASAWVYGWDEAGAAVSEVQAEFGGDFIATADYTTASLLGFALGDRDITSLAPRTDQFDFWFDRDAHRGMSAVLVGDRWRPLAEAIAEQFEDVAQVGEIDIIRFGVLLNTVTIHVATGFKP